MQMSGDTVPVCSREICTVFYPDPDNLKPVWDSNYLSGGSARFLWCGGWSCTAGKSLQLCRRSADPLLKPFVVGDYIIEGSNEGTVYEISVFYTKLKTVDNKMIVIPNGNLSNSTWSMYRIWINGGWTLW